MFEGVYYLDAGLFTIEATSPRLAVPLSSPLLDLSSVRFRDWILDILGVVLQGDFGRRISCCLIGCE